MSNFIKTPAYYDRMPLDISFVFESEKPAGKHGFCRVNGENMEFEDGTPAKFFGVMFNGAANFPEHDYSEKVARRLAQTGINIVRLHQMDDEWLSPNLYRLTSGKRLENTRKFSPESMERLDYLIYCLKEQGIYITCDMQTYRKYKSGDGVKDANLLSDIGRGYSIYDPRMIELQKEFCDQWWNHYNPYTKLFYKDDPTFVTCVICNENDLFRNYDKRKDFHRIPSYDNQFRDMFAAWLKENNIDYDAYGCELYNEDKPMIDFRIYTQRKYFKEMYDYIRSLGVKIPITGTNWTHSNGNIASHIDMDFSDVHRYFYDWSWGETEKVCAHRAITDQDAGVGFGVSTKMRLASKPLFMSEWGVPYPNSTRAEGTPYFSALACLQNLVGMTVHTYGYNTLHEYVKVLGKESSSATTGNVPYREGIFSVWNDPAQYGLFYHGALMVRRGDVKPAQKKVGGRIDVYAKEDAPSKTFTSYAETHQLYAVTDETPTDGLDEIVGESEVLKQENPDIIMSDTGEVWRNRKRSFGVVDTERTKLAYGFLGRGAGVTARRPNMKIELNGMTIDPFTDFATIALSSLTDDPIEKSDNLLLSTIGRTRNTGYQADGDKQIDNGHEPILSEVIDAVISFKTEKENLRVWAINAEGFYVGRLPATYEDGVFTFHTGLTFPAIYYLIMEE